MPPIFRRLPYFKLLPLLILATVLLGLSGYPLSAVQAQLDTNQPSLAYASTVECIRAGADLGQPSHVSPRFATTCFGSRWSPGGYTDASVSDQGDAIPADPAVLEFGDGKSDAPGEPGHFALATLGEAGAVYGVAYSSGQNGAAPAGAARQSRLFAGAFTKRVTRYGAAGPGGIYVVNRATGATTPYVMVPDVVPGPDGLPGDPGDGTAATFPNGLTTYTPQMGGLHQQFQDQAVIPYVSKTGLGDVELDADERFLYVVNLNTRRVVRVDTWSANPQSTLTVLPQIPNPGICASGAGDFRPFALHVTARSLYLGYTCTAETTGDRAHLSAGVWRYDLQASAWSTTPAVSFPLAAYDAQRGNFSGLPLAWLPWDNAFGSVHPLPVLTGITFDESGAMIIGLRDRAGDYGTSYLIPSQQGRAFGDILRAEPAGFGQWNAPTTGAEVYADDDPQTHNERSWGALAYVPGRHDGSYGGEVLSTLTTPYQLNAAGTAWFDAAGGSPTAREELYNATMDARFAKTAGLGDTELLCVWRAFGDWVFLDANGNGVQDAGEAGISGVRLQLFAASDTTFANPLASVTTGAVSGMSGNWRIYADPWQSYVVRVDPTMFGPNQPLAGYRVTLPNRGGNDNFDSDASLAGVLAIPSASNGDLNVTYDIGVTAEPLIGDRVFRDADGDGVQDAGEAGIAGVNVELLSASGTILASTTTDANGLYYFDVQPATGYTVRLAANNFSAGGSLAGLILSPQDRGGNDATDSDASQLTRTIAVPGQPQSGANLTFDFGLMSTVLANGTVGDFVWQDDGDGRQEVGEPGVAGVTVRLIDSATGAVVSTTTTDANGRYRFSNVAPGTYVVEFVPPSGAQPTPRDASGVADDLDSDADSSTNWRTPPFTVIADTDNQTLDLGLILPVNVRIQKNAPAAIAVGQSLTYTLTYTNDGPGIAQGVTVTDTLPSGVTFVSATPAASSQAGQTLSWTIGTLTAGQSATITVQTTVNGDAPATLVNTTRITTTSTETTPTDNTSSTTTIVQRPEVTIRKTGPATGSVGDQLSYTLAYTNTGTAPAAGVVVSDTLPSGLTFVSATPALSSQAGQTLSWTIGTLTAGQSGTITVVARSASTLADGTQVVNTARISTSSPGDDPSNNTSTVTTTLRRVNVRVAKTGPATAVTDGQISYTLDYENTSAIDAAGVVVTDTLPLGLTFVSATPAPSSRSGQTVVWTIGDVPAGATGRITLVARVAANLPNNTAVTNQVRIDTTTPGDDPSDNTDSATTTISTPTAIQLAYFKAERTDAGVAVRWGTLKEAETKSFRIVRSTTPNVSTATTVAAVASTGSQGGDYQVLDEAAPTSGLLYYWLVEVELSDHEHVFGPVLYGSQLVYLPVARR